MIQRPLGKNGPLVSAIGQGTWGIGGYFSTDKSDDISAIDMIKLGLDIGLTFIDTAEAYGGGHAEKLVGKAIRGRRSEAFIATKVSPEHLRSKDVICAAETSLHRLNTDYIDLYQIHWPNPSIPIEETLESMEKLVEQGKVRFIGLSNFNCRGLNAVLSCSSRPPIALQVEYNLFDRTIERNLLPSCKKNGMALIAYSPLDQGKLIDKAKSNKALMNIAEKHNRTVAQVILNWLVMVKGVFPIPKAINPVHLKQNALALDFSLDSADQRLIDTTFVSDPVSIPANKVQVDNKGLERFIPTADDLTKDIACGETIKPIRVVASQQNPNQFDLVEGKLRYWAWVKAFGIEKDILALIR
ncbi:MAG: aldo/keto reductase [Desulfamplus sp.]|nr:aldo/keto reductase [Desulfamplus sp.]